MEEVSGQTGCHMDLFFAAHLMLRRSSDGLLCTDTKQTARLRVGPYSGTMSCHKAMQHPLRPEKNQASSVITAADELAFFVAANDRDVLGQINRLMAHYGYVGITDYAQDSLGEVVYVELPPVGERFAADEEIANVESVKAASAIYNPVAGIVDTVNEELDGSPELINEDCYVNHLYTLKDFDAAHVGILLDAAGYAEFLKTLD